MRLRDLKQESLLPPQTAPPSAVRLDSRKLGRFEGVAVPRGAAWCRVLGNGLATPRAQTFSRDFDERHPLILEVLAEAQRIRAGRADAVSRCRWG